MRLSPLTYFLNTLKVLCGPYIFSLFIVLRFIHSICFCTSYHLVFSKEGEKVTRDSFFAFIFLFHCIIMFHGVIEASFWAQVLFYDYVFHYIFLLYFPPCQAFTYFRLAAEKLIFWSFETKTPKANLPASRLSVSKTFLHFRYRHMRLPAIFAWDYLLFLLLLSHSSTHFFFT